MFKLCLLFFISVSLLLSDTETDGLNKINFIREGVGLNKLSFNKDLWKSSKNHTIYLYKLNDGIKHIQNIRTDDFTGTNPWDRALFVGYNHKDVSENISLGLDTYNTSIDLLMTAIYHRFGFLNFNIDEIGFFKYDTIATYNMGNSVIRDVCSSPSNKEIEFPICADKHYISRNDYLNKLKSIEQNNPDFIVFPFDNSYDNLPSFYDETPNPVPDKIVTGNPISIQFNPTYISSINIKSFKVYDSNNKELSGRLLTSNNDPNKKFTMYQYAFFPFERLKWGNTYYSEIKGTVNNKPFSYSWTFFTKRLDGDIFSVSSISPFSYYKDTDFYLTFDPKTFGRITMFKSTCSNISFVDYNTLKINLSSPCFIELNNFGQFNLSLLK